MYTLRYTVGLYHTLRYTVGLYHTLRYTLVGEVHPSVYPGGRGTPWYIHRWVWEVHPGIYTGEYGGYTPPGYIASLYHPGYTTSLPVHTLLYATVNSNDEVRDDEALGSTLRLIWCMRRIESSQTPKV